MYWNIMTGAASALDNRRVCMQRPLIAALLAATTFAIGCGHSEEEWRAQLDKYNQLQNGCNTHTAQLDKDLAAARQQVADLEEKLRATGVDLQAKSTQVSKLNMTLEEREKALAAYQARARQLEQIRARFDQLRKKLEELVQFGLAMNIRHNKMVISLPGDVLFDTGKDTLKKEGQDILKKVATILRSDKSLNDRDYQVAGHTDNQPLQGGPYHDNWGLSLMRARAVLVFLVSKDGSLPRQHWSAAGYGDTDPVASNTTKDGQQKNRRSELVVLPDVDEMLDLQTLTH